jgi:predicted O-methyltransferase YrrM
MTTLHIQVPTRHSMYAEYDLMASSPETVDLLCSLVLLLQPAVIVESGTYHGHAALAMAQACKEMQHGHVWTADVEDFCVQGMPTALAAAGLADRVTYHTGGYADMLETYDLQGIGFAWLDASHKDDPRLRAKHLALTRPRMASTGLILMDDLAEDWPGAAVLRRKADLYLPFGRGIGFFYGAA